MRPEVHDIFERLDVDTLAWLQRLASVSPPREQQRLRAAGRPYLSPSTPCPSQQELDATARWVVRRAVRRRRLTSRVVGLVGAPGVPSDVLSRALGLLRMAQRLAIVYGFDLTTDHGHVALRRALAAGIGVELPTHGPLARRATELVRPGETVGGTLLREVVLWNARETSPVRALPIVGALGGSGDLSTVGHRMTEVLRGLAPPITPPPTEDAVEL